jgi:hypothetical protein
MSTPEAIIRRRRRWGPPSRNESIIICPSIGSLEVEVNPKLRAQVGMPIRGHVDPFDRCNLLDILQALEHPTFKAAVRRIVAACNALASSQGDRRRPRRSSVLNLPGNDVSTYLDGMKARAARCTCPVEVDWGADPMRGPLTGATEPTGLPS